MIDRGRRQARPIVSDGPGIPPKKGGPPFRISHPRLLRLALAALLLASVCYTGLQPTRAQSLAGEVVQRPDLRRGPAPPSPSYDFTIEKYVTEAVIEADGVVSVRERIEVDFHRPRHGIYRDIPFRYRDDLGQSRKTPLRVVSVTDAQNNRRKYSVDTEGSLIHIRIGDPRRFVEGRQDYVITYRVENVILFLQDHDEFYWNVTGNDWKVPIREAGASLRLAGRVKASSTRASCYTGLQGSREQSCRFEVRGSETFFSATRTLNPGEGLTVVLGWDSGAIRPPSPWRRWSWTLNLRENWVFLLPLLATLFMVRQWFTRGRDPRVAQSVVVRYEPPKAGDAYLSPGEVGALIDEQMDPRDITAAVVGLAVNGFVQIREVKKEGWLFDSTDYELIRLREADSSLMPFERELLERLFTSGPTTRIAELKNNFYKNLDVLRDSLFEGLRVKNYFREKPETVRLRYRYIGLAVAGLGLAGMVFLGSFWRLFLAAALCGAPLILFAPLMPAKTRSGAQSRLEILGFREFLTRAEKDRLERMNDPHLFSRYLPYAVALNVVDNWSDAFRGLFQEPPDWYRSSGGFHGFSPSGFSHSLDRAASSLGSALISSPRGSGSGGGFGGGSSGGGFGGGGGGSW